MNLIDEDEQEEQLSDIASKKKKVLVGLVISIFLLILIVMLMSVFGKKKEKPLTVVFDGKNIEMAENLIIKEENTGKDYIMIKKIADLSKYNYIEGEYLSNDKETDEDSFYLRGTNQVICFNVDSKDIFKIKLNDSIDKAKFTLKNNIIQKNNDNYIALEDLGVGCNLLYGFSTKNNQMVINTIDNYINTYQAKLKEKNYTISDESENKNSIVYNLLVVKDDKEKYGIMDLDLNTKIINQYTSLKFDEFSRRFIVSNDAGKYGVINESNATIIDFKYDSIEQINNSPLLYLVKQNKKCGILDGDGKIKIDIDYSEIGIKNAETSDRLLFIENIGNEKATGIIVCKNQKYGILNLKNGKPIVECELDSIYFKDLSSGKRQYRVRIEDREYTLEKYLQERSTTVVDMN